MQPGARARAGCAPPPRCGVYTAHADRNPPGIGSRVPSAEPLPELLALLASEINGIYAETRTSIDALRQHLTTTNTKAALLSAQAAKLAAASNATSAEVAKLAARSKRLAERVGILEGQHRATRAAALLPCLAVATAVVGVVGCAVCVATCVAARARRSV